MAQDMTGSGETVLSENMEQTQTLDEDDTEMADEAREDADSEEDQGQARSMAPRTIFHYSRGEDDTV